jgi:glutathione peroxidase
MMTMTIIKIITTAVISLMASAVSIYTLSFSNADGATVSMAQYQGKKILLVNTATQSSRAAQYGELEQLYQQHKDSLVVIAFSSNSFGNEPLSDAAIKNQLQATYNVHYQLAGKSDVTGAQANAIYQWLGSKDANGLANCKIRGDFQKFLINRQGKITAVFDTATSPLDTRVQQAIAVGY